MFYKSTNPKWPNQKFNLTTVGKYVELGAKYYIKIKIYCSMFKAVTLDENPCGIFRHPIVLSWCCLVVLNCTLLHSLVLHFNISPNVHFTLNSLFCIAKSKG